MQGLARGDRGAFARVYAEHRRRVFGICARIVGRDRAEDVAQEAWMKIVRNARNYRPIGSLSSWICEVTRNTCLNAIRDEQSFEPIDDGAFHDEPDNESVDEIFVRLESRKRLQASFEALPAQQRAVLTMFIYEELSHAEIARAMSISIGAVKQLLLRSRENLRRHLEDKR